MRVFLAGATGVIGRPLVPALLASGHEVIAMCRNAERAEQARAAGAEAAIADALDGPAVAAAVAGARPDAIVNQLTALPKRIDPRRMQRDFEQNDRLRSEGSVFLAEAARAAGAKLVSQSIAFMYERGPAGTVHPEDDPLVLDPPGAFARTANAVKTLERTTLDAGGTVLRYGYFYGPYSSIAPDGAIVAEVRRRRMPVVGSGAGVWSFIHVDDAAAATVLALAAPPGVYNVVDDEPAAVSEWLPELAKAAGAPRPWRVPAFIARLAAGDYGVTVMTDGQGAANARAKRELGWQPAHPSWRAGFAQALAA